MGQVKVYGLRKTLQPRRQQLSDTIHNCVVEALAFPRDKRAHRFFPLEREDFFRPEGRTDDYTIIEIALIAGRSIDARKRLVRLLFERLDAELGIANNDVEISISESPACNWGFRGFHGDEVKLNYPITI